MITIVTGWSATNWEEYARNFMQSFEDNWHDNCHVLAYVEKETPFQLTGAKSLEQINIATMNDLNNFLIKHRGDPFATGKQQKPGHAWKQKCINRGYNFRFDAVKFCRIPFYIRHAAARVKKGRMIWIDADCIVFNKVEPGFINSLFPRNNNVIFLGRQGYHTECGFCGFDLPQAKPLLDEWAEYYDNEFVFTLREWHNSFVFDHVRGLHEKRGLRTHNMTPKGHRHVFFQSPIGNYIDHLKGDRRKAAGFSKERMKGRSKAPEKPEPMERTELRKA